VRTTPKLVGGATEACAARAREKILILGVSYKAGVGDTRESPALKIVKLLPPASAPGGQAVEHHLDRRPVLAAVAGVLADVSQFGRKLADVLAEGAEVSSRRGDVARPDLHPLRLGDLDSQDLVGMRAIGAHRADRHASGGSGEGRATREQRRLRLARGLAHALTCFLGGTLQRPPGSFDASPSV
jgi:hypothetical protein